MSCEGIANAEGVAVMTGSDTPGVVVTASVGVLDFSPINVGVDVKVGVGWVGVTVAVFVDVTSGAGGSAGVLVGAAKKLVIS